jgi:hypothetical protein
VGKRNGGGEVEGVKKGTKEGGEVVGQTREKEGKRRGESGWLGGGRWVRREWGEGMRGGDMHLYYGISPYRSTIQFYHTGSPYNKNANFSGLSCNSLSGYTYYIT